jgi:hypothetical protein
MLRIASMGTMVAPICWVIAPTSELTTDDPRIRSSRDVFPWSTCPMTQTIGVLIFGFSAISFPSFVYALKMGYWIILVPIAAAGTVPRPITGELYSEPPDM